MLKIFEEGHSPHLDIRWIRPWIMAFDEGTTGKHWRTVRIYWWATMIHDTTMECRENVE